MHETRLCRRLSKPQTARLSTAQPKYSHRDFVPIGDMKRSASAAICRTRQMIYHNIPQ